jgi:type I restriction enzyme S subunit
MALAMRSKLALFCCSVSLESCSAQILPKGTIVIISRGATVGRMAQLARDMAFNQTCYGLRALTGFDQDFLYYAMKFSICSIEALTYGTIFGTITKQSFQEWKILLPPLSEQTAIATILTDMDVDIVLLEQKLAKLRQLKQGMMQELLTGKTRLV